MRARGRTARRLAAASLLALLAAGVAGVVVPGQAGMTAGTGGGGWGQPVAPNSAFGYFPPWGARTGR
jgi:hypothetical protein